MAYSDEDLQKYLKKAEEVLRSKTENYLSEEDLNDIAKNLGLNIKEIAQAREDYLTRAVDDPVTLARASSLRRKQKVRIEGSQQYSLVDRHE